MDNTKQKMLESQILSNLQGESDSPFVDLKTVDPTQTQPIQSVKSYDENILNCLKYIEINYLKLYEDQKNKFILMLEELYPLSVKKVMSWGDSSLKDSNAAFQSASMLFRDYSGLNAAETIDEILTRKKETVKKSFLGKLFSSVKSNKEHEDRARMDTLRSELSLLLPGIDNVIFMLESNYVKYRLITLIAIHETSVFEDSSFEEVVSGRRQAFFYALQSIEVSLKEAKKVRNMIINNLVSIDHIIKVTIPLLHKAQQ